MTFPRTVVALQPYMHLRPVDGGFAVDTAPSGHGGVYGALQLLQLVLAAERAEPGMRVLSLHTAFLAGGRSDRPLEIAVERMQRGQSFANATLTMAQGRVPISRTVVLLTSDEPDFLRHQSPAPRRAPADDWPEWDWALWPGVTRRAPGGEKGGLTLRLGLSGLALPPTQARALTAMTTEPLVLMALLGLAAEPWAFRQGSGNVVTHTVTLLEPVETRAGLVASVDASYAGHGRAHGGGRVTDDDGNLLATFQSTGVLRGAGRPA